jgi:SAM-dependent methyltransferase
MQEYYLPDREKRFAVMLDVLETALPSRFSVVDLGCGPGSLAKRVLERFPGARLVAVDYDPVVLEIARNALKGYDNRIVWLEEDLGRPGFGDKLRSLGRIDAAISTTALHWLYPNQLRLLYGSLGLCVRSGGIFADGDNMPWEANSVLHRFSKEIKRARLRKSGTKSLWNEWWKGLRSDRYFDELFRVRRSRFPYLHSRAKSLPFNFHVKALKESGFRIVDVVWQDIEDRILVAIK